MSSASQGEQTVLTKWKPDGTLAPWALTPCPLTVKSERINIIAQLEGGKKVLLDVVEVLFESE